MGGGDSTSTVIILAATIVLVIVATACAPPPGRAPAKKREDFSIHQAKEEAYQSCHKIAMQHMRYSLAAARARAEGRLLVVIGNPEGGWVNRVTRGYDCGDVCIDMKGCKNCEAGGPGGPTRVVEGDVLEGLRTVPTDSAVVFESEVLEYPGDIAAVLGEIDRVTGGDYRRVYAVHTVGIQEESWKYHTTGAQPARPGPEYLAERRGNRWGYHQKLGEGLAQRVIYRFPPQDPYEWAAL